ncbi:MAG TPA: hypothetical protein PLI01_12360 [Nitrospira sp.]|nr:hypothetical protein [Nitrospira sp.]
MSPHLTHAKPGAGIAASPATKPANLICSHCQGHLVADLYIDTVDAGGHVWIRALRCVRCGNIEEAGRTGLASQTHAGKGVWKREGTARKGLDDEMIVLGT